MQIDLKTVPVSLVGDRNPVALAALEALRDNGAIDAAVSDLPDILVVSLPLLPTAAHDPRPLIETAREAAGRMTARGHGRIVFLVSALAVLPMRRHPAFSAAMASVAATVRGLAMQCGPRVLINAVGVGAVGDPLVAGDAAMLSHAAVARPGTVGEVTDTLLFLCDPLNTYTTGQILLVDGGWSTGYGRHF